MIGGYGGEEEPATVSRPPVPRDAGDGDAVVPSSPVRSSYRHAHPGDPMPRVTCAACGAPSVLGASRCPKCLAPFGGASPTAGVVLVEPTPRPAGPVPARRWLAVALGGLGLLGGMVAILMAPGRRTAAVVPSAAPAGPVAPPTPVPVAAADSGRDSTTTVVEADAGATFAYETVTWVRVRSAPMAEAPVLAVLAPGTRVEVSAIGRGWLTMRWEGRPAWVGASLLTRVR